MTKALLVELAHPFLRRSASCRNLAFHLDLGDRFQRTAVQGVAWDLEKIQTKRRLIVERRKSNRYWLGVPVTFLWRDSQQAEHEGLGLTRDLSIRGAFVLTTSPPPLQANIKLKAFFTPVLGVPARMHIHGEGKVVRVEPIKDDEGRGGFAVEGKHFVLRRGEE